MINRDLIWEYLKVDASGALSFQTLLAAGTLAYLGDFILLDPPFVAYEMVVQKCPQNSS